MLIDCTTRGCLKQNEAKLDVSTDKVICEECGNEIAVTRFTKKALKDLGQIVRGKEKKPFQALCKNCNANKSLYVSEDKAYCEDCRSQVHITPAFLQGLKIYLGNKDKE